MKTLALVTCAAALLAATPALAASDLETSIVSPGNVLVDDVSTYDVVVTNVGNRTAKSVSLSIQLPETATSPNVYVMGLLGNVDSRCSQSGTELTCSLGRLRKNRSATVSFDLALPYSAAPLEVSASASTTSSENDYANNDDSDVALQSYYSNAITAQTPVTNWHCTGQGLSSFYECEVSPGSITDHPHTFEANGDITFPFATSIYGFWQQSSPDVLTFQYYDSANNDALVADFVGVGVAGGCWEGLTTFPNSPWVAPYQICP